MAIAPITGKLRKSIWRDLTIAMGLGVAGAYWYWYGSHLKYLKKKEDFYLKLEKQKAESNL
ncbi:hypothetical protein M422DRAFT_239932 [Sphaerobolus stellatus SS14]|nr:hypothetical protein M422DRAFT_239932 [Sphaerobolus stellatus SS14]